MNRSAHHFNELLADRETQAGAAVFARRGPVGLGEVLENAALRFRADSGTGIADLEPKHDLFPYLLDSGHAYYHFALVGEFYRVTHEVRQYLAKTQRITFDAGQQSNRNRTRELQPLALGAFGEQFHDVFDRPAQ